MNPNFSTRKMHNDTVYSLQSLTDHMNKLNRFEGFISCPCKKNKNKHFGTFSMGCFLSKANVYTKIFSNQQ